MADEEGDENKRSIPPGICCWQKAFPEKIKHQAVYLSASVTPAHSSGVTSNKSGRNSAEQGSTNGRAGCEGSIF